MTTTKARLTIYFHDRRSLDNLVQDLRALAPLDLRGGITRSTVTEAAVRLAVADLEAHGAQSAIAKTMVTLPALEVEP